MNDQSFQSQPTNIVSTISMQQLLNKVSGKINQQASFFDIEEDNSSETTKMRFQYDDMQGFNFPEGIEYQQQSASPPQNKMDYYEDSNSNESSTHIEEGRVVKLLNKDSNKTNNNGAINYDIILKQSLTPSRLLSSPRKFYIFLDQMIDLDYFENLKRPDKFVENNQAIQLQKGFRATNSVTHRIDNSFIDIDSELFDSSPQSIDYIVEILKSMGNKDLLIYVNCLLEFQRNIKTCQTLIQAQSLDEKFLAHRLERQAVADLKFKEITSKCDPNKLIFYQRYTLNYDKYLYQTTKAGYSPALYKVLDNGSYCFMDKLLKEGFYDPMSQVFRLGDCFYRTCYFMSQLPKEFDQTLGQNAELDIVTCDNFRFPVTMKLNHYYLEQEYDKQNGLDLKFCELLAVYEFEFKDLTVYKNLQEIRSEAVVNQCKLETIEGENVDWNQFDYVQTQFFNKYYSDQVQNLVKKGNKWYKRCGFVELPTKKIKQ